jgi:hypothetical protein
MGTRDFYVTVQDAGRTGFLLGPYSTHEAALSNVERGRRLAEEANSRAVFYAFGTSSVPAGTEGVPVVFADQTATCFGCGAGVPDEPGIYYCATCVQQQAAAVERELKAFDDFHAFADACARASC